MQAPYANPWTPQHCHIRLSCPEAMGITLALSSEQPWGETDGVWRASATWDPEMKPLPLGEIQVPDALEQVEPIAVDINFDLGGLGPGERSMRYQANTGIHMKLMHRWVCCYCMSVGLWLQMWLVDVLGQAVQQEQPGTEDKDLWTAAYMAQPLQVCSGTRAYKCSYPIESKSKGLCLSHTSAIRWSSRCQQLICPHLCATHQQAREHPDCITSS